MIQKNEPILELSNPWINEQIKNLWVILERNGESKIRIFEPDKEFYKLSLTDQLEILLKRYGIPFNGISFQMRGDLGEPGRVELNRDFDVSGVSLKPGQSIASISKDGTFYILDMTNKLLEKAEKPLTIKKTEICFFISQDFLGCPSEIGSIFAHEIAHLYRHFKNIQRLDDEKNELEEYLTDITAFVIGLGKLMLKGCQTQRRINTPTRRGIIHQTLGYLKPDQMRFVQKQIQLLLER